MFLKNAALTTALLAAFSLSLYAIGIDECLPEVFDKKSGIKVNAKTFGGVPGYEIQKFGEEERNRNHFDSRNNTKIKFLVIHYSACDFKTAVKFFTKNQPDNRASAHYVISQTEEKVKGGSPFKLFQKTNAHGTQD